jgi:CRP-like cAMP-binding protein
VPKNDHGYLSFEDNDIAVEWCENRLAGDTVKALAGQVALADCQLLKELPAKLIESLQEIAATRVYASGEKIIVAGQVSDDSVYFICSGQVSILVPLEDGAHQRIASLGPGMNFGEMVLLGQTTRSATVSADTEVTCRILSASDINRLAVEVPELKIALLESLSRDMAGKLRRATQWIAALA